MLLTNYAIRFRTAVIVFTVTTIIIGILSYNKLPREGAPDVVIPYIFVAAPYEGTSPQEMEKLIAIPLERTIRDLDNVKDVTTESAESLVSVKVEFLPGMDMDMALQLVKNKVDLARPDLPDDLDEPIVLAVNLSTAWSIIGVALSGNVELDRLKVLASEMEDAIRLIPGVKDVGIAGAREREVRVNVDLARLAAYKLTLHEVLLAVATENLNVSAGNMDIGNGKFQVRLPQEFIFPAEMNNLVVAVRNGSPIYLSDIAQVQDVYKDLTDISRINGEPCVSVDVTKRSGQNTVVVVGRVKEYLKKFYLPPDVKMTITRDESDNIGSLLRDLENNIFAGFVLVFGVVLFFMGWRNSLFVGLAIPLSLLMSFTVFSFLGITMNMVVLFSLVLALGMLVDNAIVITENIFRHRTLGESRHDAARHGASEVAWPVITSTITTLVAFWPLLYWPSIIGQFMRYLPLTLIITLTASLVVGIAVNPAICSIFIQGSKVKVTHDKHGEIVSTHWFVQGYERMLRSALNYRWFVLVFFVLMLIVSFQAYGRWGRGLELFPDTEPRSATVVLRYPQGTPIEKTDATLKLIEKLLHSYDQDIRYYQTVVGDVPDLSLTSAGTHVGCIRIEFVDIQKRKRSSMELVDDIRAAIGPIPGAEVVVDREKEGPPAEPPISIEISGEDFGTLGFLATQIKQAVRVVPGLVDLKDDFERALPELQFNMDRKQAGLFGVTPMVAGEFLQTAIYGIEASKLRAGNQEYDITVRLAEKDRQSADIFQRIYLPVGDASLPLMSIGEVKYSGGQGKITRKNYKRVVTITGELEGRSIDAVLADVQKVVGAMVIPPGYNIAYTGANADMNESSDFLMQAFWIAIALIVVIMVLQFNSVFIPLIIMSSVVFSLIGVIWGLLAFNMRFGVIMTGLGVISLAGVVVNNAIVLLDCTLQRRREGMSATEAIVTAGRLRLRPVLLTAATAILGLVPMVFGWSLEIHEWPWRIVTSAESSAWWAPMAVAVIFGLALATILTLVVVPVMYSISESFAELFRRHIHIKE